MDDLVAHCGDCETDTLLNNEYYMVLDSVWNEAIDQSPASFLCIGCLEERLHRKLQEADFANVLLNHPIGFKRSQRLEDRLGHRFIDLSEEDIEDFKLKLQI